MNNKVFELLDLTDQDIAQKYRGWDKGDCSDSGLVQILLYQTIKQHRKENGEYRNREDDDLFEMLNKRL